MVFGADLEPYITGHMICYRSQEAGQSDDSIDKAAATICMILGDDASLLDDPLMNTINVDHVKQKLESLVSSGAVKWASYIVNCKAV